MPNFVVCDSAYDNHELVADRVEREAQGDLVFYVGTTEVARFLVDKWVSYKVLEYG